MGLMSNEVSVDFPHAVKDCYTVARGAIQQLTKYKLTSENETIHLLEFSVSPGMSSFTFGDIVTIGFVQNPNGTTKATIASTAKVPSVLASVQQNKNVQTVLATMTEALKDCVVVTPVDTTLPQEKSGVTVKERLQALDELHDEKLISDEEYAQKRTEILKAL